MSISNLSAAANDTLQSLGKTAVTLIDASHAGGSRMLNGVDSRWENLVSRRGARLSDKLRHDLIAAQREITGYYAKGLELLSAKSTSAVQAVVDVSTAGVDRLSGRFELLEAALQPLPLSSATVIAQPFAEVGREVADFVAQRAGKAVLRVDADAASSDAASSDAASSDAALPDAALPDAALPDAASVVAKPVKRTPARPRQDVALSLT